MMKDISLIYQVSIFGWTFFWTLLHWYILFSYQHNLMTLQNILISGRLSSSLHILAFSEHLLWYMNFRISLLSRVVNLFCDLVRSLNILINLEKIYIIRYECSICKHDIFILALFYFFLYRFVTFFTKILHIFC